MNKMLYVSERDADLFDRAQALSGTSLSATVVQALKLYVDREEARQQDMKEVRVRIYRDGTTQIRRFYGRRITEVQSKSSPTELSYFSIYATAKGHYALYVRKEPDWSSGNRASGPGHDPQYEITSALDVFDDLDALRLQLPHEVAARLDRALAVEPVVDLDI